MKSGAESKGFPVDILYDSLDPWAAGEAKNYQSFYSPLKVPDPKRPGKYKTTLPDATSIDNFYKATIGKHVRFALHYPNKPVGLSTKTNLAEHSKPHAAKIDKVDLGNYMLAISTKTKLPVSSKMTGKFGSRSKVREGKPKFEQATVEELENMAAGLVPNFLTGIYDSDRLAKNKQEILNAILNSKKRMDVVWGPAGAGKSTYTKGQYPGSGLVKQISDIN